MNRRPSLNPWPVVPTSVIALNWVAITERPTAHQGRLRLARKYDSGVRSRRVRLTPSDTSHPMYATTMTQSMGCMLRHYYIADCQLAIAQLIGDCVLLDCWNGLPSVTGPNPQSKPSITIRQSTIHFNNQQSAIANQSPI